MVQESKAIGPSIPKLIDKFAISDDIEPENIRPRIREISGSGQDALLFRMAASTWTVPVSSGYGRRMRFLVEDQNNGKLIGILALGDPVIGMSSRDEFVGWTTQQRNRRLSSVMDAYVCGAVPPYNMLLGGKLVTSLMGSREVNKVFNRKYRNRPSEFSGERKYPRLVLVTVTSAFGRSSMYNRVKIPGIVNLLKLDEMTGGWGHFKIGDELFSKMRALLRETGHKYADGHSWDPTNRGPNWKMRVIREASGQVGFDTRSLYHGVSREVFAMPLVDQWREYLRGEINRCKVELPSVKEIGEAAVARWLLPRSERLDTWREWDESARANLFNHLRADQLRLLL